MVFLMAAVNKENENAYVFGLKIRCRAEPPARSIARAYWKITF